MRHLAALGLSVWEGEGQEGGGEPRVTPEALFRGLQGLAAENVKVRYAPARGGRRSLGQPLVRCGARRAADDGPFPRPLPTVDLPTGGAQGAGRMLATEKGTQAPGDQRVP